VALVALKVGFRPGAEHTTCPFAVGVVPAAKVQVLPARQGKALPAARVVTIPPSMYLQVVGTLLQATQQEKHTCHTRANLCIIVS
jgi:hypothetical protein